MLPDTAPSGRDDVSAPYPARQNVLQSPRRYDPPETDASFLSPPSPFAAFTPPTPSFRSTSALPSSPPRPSPTATSARCVPRNSDIQRARLDYGITRSSGRADRPDLACLDPRVARIRRDSVGVHQTAKHSLYSSFRSRKLTSLALSSTLQVNPVYVVCHEDRAFLCRSCDISIHSANAHVAKHQRFLMTGVSLELEAVGAAAKEGEVAETPVVAQAPTAKKAKGIKRKMEHQFQAPSASSEDGLVPSMGGAEAAADPMASEEEFNSFVQDFLGNTKEGKDGNMADFLDNFFDDIPAVGNDFGVVPVM